MELDLTVFEKLRKTTRQNAARPLKQAVYDGYDLDSLELPKTPLNALQRVSPTVEKTWSEITRKRAAEQDKRIAQLQEIVTRHAQERNRASTMKSDILKTLRTPEKENEAWANRGKVVIIMAECIGLLTSDRGYPEMVKKALQSRDFPLPDKTG